MEQTGPNSALLLGYEYLGLTYNLVGPYQEAEKSNWMAHSRFQLEGLLLRSRHR
jgi:hypothetical protein